MYFRCPGHLRDQRGLEGLKALGPGMALAGPAYTLQYEPVPEGEAAQAGEFIDEVPEGHVVVIANGGRQYCTVWGDLLTYAAKIRGCEELLSTAAAGMQQRSCKLVIRYFRSEAI